MKTTLSVFSLLFVLLLGQLQAQTELVTNGDFANGSEGWSVWANPDVKAAATLTVENEEAKIEIQTSGTAGWHIQLQQIGYTYTKNKRYELNFTARANVATDISVDLGQEGGNYTSYSNAAFSLSTEDKSFTMELLQGNATEASGRIVFNISQALASTIFIDNVSIKEYTVAVVEQPERTLTFAQNKKLGRGINLGNILEAPNEGEWGLTLEEAYFKIIAEKGFSSVRIPIRWSAHALTTAPYTIDAAFMNRVKWAIEMSSKYNLYAVINLHHYDELFQEPAKHEERFLALWNQISSALSSSPNTVLFEVLNEPNTNLTAQLWNELLPKAIETIRKTSPTRTLVIGSAEWGGVSGMLKLKLPTDEHLIFTVHYYEPFNFTHQGAEWVENPPALGTTWDATQAEKDAVRNHMEQIRQFSVDNNIPVYVGEFGAYSKADSPSRGRWSGYCRELFEEFGFSWSYWEFGSGFGVYNPATKKWDTALLNGLIPPTDMPTGVGEIQKKTLIISQVGTILHIVAPQKIERMELFSLSGQLLENTTQSEGVQAQIQVPSKTIGTYILRVFTQDAVLSQQIVVRQH